MKTDDLDEIIQSTSENTQQTFKLPLEANQPRGTIQVRKTNTGGVLENNALSILAKTQKVNTQSQQFNLKKNKSQKDYKIGRGEISM